MPFVGLRSAVLRPLSIRQNARSLPARSRALRPLQASNNFDLASFQKVLESTLDEVLKDRLSPITKQQSRMEKMLGNVVEANARTAVSRDFGSSYQRSLLALSLQDLALILPEEELYRAGRETLQAPLVYASRAAEALLQSPVPYKLLETLEKKYQVGSTQKYCKCETSEIRHISNRHVICSGSTICCTRGA